MTDFQAVVPPTAVSTDGKAAFADAVQRAKQIAAKIGVTAVPGVVLAGDPALLLGLKRPLDDLSGDESDRKKAMAFQNMNDPNHLFSMNPTMIGLGSITETYQVPSNLVGLIIGRGGETISKIQGDTQCKVQVAAQNDLDNPAVRTCTLTGTPESVGKARLEIDGIVYNSKENSTDQVMIAANKVGLIIGKKGETIKRIMEVSGARLMMIQDDTANTGLEKPLKITGDPGQAKKAKEMIQELIDKQQEFSNSNKPPGMPSFNPRGGGGGDSREFTVPRNSVRVIIGKKGDMIRSIQEETGARVQFKEDDGSEDRGCIITGPPQSVEQAHEIVDGIVQESKQRDMDRGMRGRGRGRGGGPGNFGGRGGFQGGFRSGDEMREMYIPTNRCGLIIGRGGANIQAITAESGARIEMTQRLNDRGEKVFTLQGSLEQVVSAERLIQEKLEQGPMGMGRGGGYRGYGGGGGGGGNDSGSGGGGGWGNGNNSYGGGEDGGGGGGIGGGSGWGDGQQQQQQQPPQQQQQQQPSEQNKNDPAWQQYYQQCYQGQQQPQQPGAPSGGMPAGQQPAAPAGASQGGQPAPGQQDYTAQWQEYYRYKQQTEGAAATPQTDPSQPAAGAPAGQQDYSAAWREYFRTQQQMMYGAGGVPNPAAGGDQSGGAGQPPNQQAPGYQ